MLLTEEIITDCWDRYKIVFENVVFPEDDLLLLGSGQKEFPPEIMKYPTIKINTSRLQKDENVFGVICNLWEYERLLSITTPKYTFVAGNRRRQPTAFAPHSDTTFFINRIKSFQLYEHVRDYITAGENPHSKPTTGFHIMFFILFSNVKRIHVAGFDYHKKNDFKFHNGNDWRPGCHDLNLEWTFIHEAIDYVNEREKKKVILY